MVVIRLARAGSKKAPFFRVVVTNKLSPRDGSFIEKIGYFNPVARGQSVVLELDLARVDYWVSKGAQLSDTAKSLVKRARKEQASVAAA